MAPKKREKKRGRYPFHIYFGLKEGSVPFSPESYIPLVGAVARVQR